MRLDRKAATKDSWTTDNSERRIARLRAYFSALLALGGMGLLVSSLIQGRFEKMRHFGTITFAESPFGFVAMAMGWAVAISFFTWLVLVFWHKSRS